ncbi:PfkB family carbohydrate kinase [Methylobacterium soli]|uniref:Ribokinase n=1 Tax=Methylobacterium soli TaxID=553447 RepID=A0A6L3T094_9HYPH|nr:PfkB family carbohydrate kinase [Methylobacterium soli]KAB1079879.1 ribokinase [Methylobacterium soli]GJE46493.1 Bifunctional ribokinase/ribose-5-phosphate isomerase A [Methylobacterium soli]
MPPETPSSDIDAEILGAPALGAPAPPRLFVLASFIAASAMRVSRLPEPGQSLAASAYTFEAGGKGLNLAVAARRLGAAVDGIMAVGSDPLAALAEPALHRAGLPGGMLRRFEAQTGAGIGFTQDDGENCLAVFLGANRLLDGAAIRARAAAITAADLVLAQFEISDAAIAEAFRLAREAGRRTLLNPSPFRPIPPAILRDTAILVVNAGEARLLAAEAGIPEAGTPETGIPEAGNSETGNRETGNRETCDGEAALAAGLRARGPDLVVITRGAGGATAYPAGSAPHHQAAFPVAAVDTLGAGDAFAAGLAVALAEGRSLPEAMRWGAACGALVAMQLGVFDALPGRAAVAAFLDAGTPSALF